ncbi:MAG: nicotinate-nucleotide--dimethylbenzimidazole phosphoribosyltransferase [Clostridiales bacterium]|nr:nicotinate-nucleotide--dimethylbenzimidazole phosphoribosyltransferase [Clostridiales bacterium]MCF8021416.1 nicotinate-nucleotide--dimethylbenzimidazole phosphoribosyltransferase [Clostridiales bacterium]
MQVLNGVIKSIEELNEDSVNNAQERMENLIKPPGSLGVLEDLAIKMAGIMGDSRPVIGEKSVIVMAGDHGVVQEGVSIASQEVTRQMLSTFLNGIGGVGVLARQAGARVVVVDVGVAGGPVNVTGVISRKVKPGTQNIARGPAMTREEAVQAIEAGIEVVRTEINRGAGVIATGDMGIGNTTPSSAILAVLGNYTALEVTGRGTLVNDDVMSLKCNTIASALEINKPDCTDGLDVLSKVGGFEIAGLTGVILGAAANNVPVIIDGFISTAAAMIAASLEKKCINYMIASHLSSEDGHKLMLEYLGLKPMLYMNMRLGEGTGAVLAMNLVDAGCRILNEMATFSEAEVMDLEDDKILK